MKDNFKITSSFIFGIIAIILIFIDSIEYNFIISLLFILLSSHNLFDFYKTKHKGYLLAFIFNMILCIYFIIK